VTATDSGLMDWVVELARAAGRMAAEAFGKGGAVIERKSDGSVVTETDRAVEALLWDRITEAFPDDGILGEELGERPGSSARRWLLDPIDHTEAFVLGVGEFSTIVAVEDEQGIVAAAVDVPIMGETMWAGRGRGAHRNGSPMQVSATETLRGAYLATSDLDDWPPGILRAAMAAGLRIRTWGGGYGVGLAVSGRVDAFVDYDLDAWDVAPALALAAEAGGKCTAFDGKTRLDGGNCVVAGPGIHSMLMNIFGEPAT